MTVAAAAPPSQDGKRLDAETERATRAFLARLGGRFFVEEAWLYGSRARGDHKPGSDADLAVVLAGERGDRYKISGDFSDIGFEVLRETGVLVHAFPLWRQEIEQPELFANPRLIASIKREGVRL